MVEKQSTSKILDNIVEKSKTEKPKEKQPKNIRSNPRKKEEMVEGIFRNWEVRGAPITFSYSADKNVAKKYTLEDGKTYILPISVAKHLNRCCYPASEYELDKHGNPLGKRETMVRRYEFRRVDDLSS